MINILKNSLLPTVENGPRHATPIIPDGEVRISDATTADIDLLEQRLNGPEKQYGFWSYTLKTRHGSYSFPLLTVIQRMD